MSRTPATDPVRYSLVFLRRQRVRDGGPWLRRQVSADQRGQLRALQELRHQRPLWHHRLDASGGSFRTQVSATVNS